MPANAGRICRVEIKGIFGIELKQLQHLIAGPALKPFRTKPVIIDECVHGMKVNKLRTKECNSQFLPVLTSKSSLSSIMLHGGEAPLHSGVSPLHSGVAPLHSRISPLHSGI